MLIMWDVLMRCNYFGCAPLQVVLTELTTGGWQVCRYGKLAGWVCLRLKDNDAAIHPHVNSLKIFCFCITNILHTLYVRRMQSSGMWHRVHLV
jgi:hypothetical protein